MKIAQAAKQLELSTATLRYYENIGLIRPIRRDENGIRDYTEEDIQWIEFIKCMRNAGLFQSMRSENIRLYLLREMIIHCLYGKAFWLMNEKDS